MRFRRLPAFRCLMLGYAGCIFTGIVVGAMGFFLAWEPAKVATASAAAGTVVGIGGLLGPIVVRGDSPSRRSLCRFVRYFTASARRVS